MNVSRRSLAGAGLLSAAAVIGDARAQSSPTDADVLRRLGFLSPNDPQPEIGAVGSGESRPDHVRRAFRLLWDCPRTGDHMEIARYFQNLEATAGGKRFNAEWPEPEANPLITSFFGMTSTLPNQGDQTAWCAAFASFVLYAAGKKSKFTASSQGYRDYGQPRDEPGGANPPQAGDIAVFRRLNAEGAETGFGHVGFYVSETNGRITVLGGNQGGAAASGGAVMESVYNRNSARLPLFACYPVSEA